MQDFGYSFSLCYGFGGGAPNLRKVVTFISSDPADMRDADFRDKVRLEGVMIAAHADSLAPGHGDYYLPDREILPLTGREQQVLRHLAHGHKNKQIALELDIAEITVRKHLQSVRLKLEARSREEAIAVAVRAGLLSL